MNKTTIYLCIALCWITCSNCRGFNQSFNTRFYTTNNSGVTWHLYIDDADKGKLPFIAAEPDCDNASIQEHALLLRLPSGKYDIDVKDNHGHLGYSGRIVLKRSHSSTELSSSSSWRNAGVAMANDNDCLVNKVFFP